MAEAHYKTNSNLLDIAPEWFKSLCIRPCYATWSPNFSSSDITGFFHNWHFWMPTLFELFFIKEGTSLRRTGVSEKEIRDSHDRKTVLQENELKVLRRVDKDPFLSKVGMSWVCRIKGKINFKHCLLVNETFS